MRVAISICLLINNSLLHARIYLYRPMLSQFYARKTSTPSLSDRLLREYAGMCIETAQKITGLVTETLEADAKANEPIGLLPWWNRVYYLHIAGVIFLAAMVRSDQLFTDSVGRSWQDILAALRAHTHLSAYVQQCVCTFQTLAARIQMVGSSGEASALSSLSTAGGDGMDLFQDIDFDFNDFLFGTDEGVDFSCNQL